MSEAWAKAALAAYRVTGRLAYPLIGSYVGWRASRGKEENARRRERYGIAGQERPAEGSLVWVHAASIGEAGAVTPMVREIAADGHTILMTTGTTSSATLVAERLGDTVIHQYVPLDLKPSVARFLDHWRPDLAIVAESEIWPITMQELRNRRIPQVLVNARLSDRSFRRWSAMPALAEALLENLAHVVAQSAVDGERFHMLGARAVTVAGNLKADIPAPAVDRVALGEMIRAIGLRPVWAAISTHEGEEVLAAEAHRRLAEERPRLLTIVVPRHVERADEIAEMFRRRGLAVARRSLGELPDPTTEIFIGDTIGEMGLYLRLTEIAFMGKSLSSEGGQNPLEAAMLGTALLSGRNVQNFREVYQKLLAARGCVILEDPAFLPGALADLLGDPVRRRAMGNAAFDAVAEMRGALPRTMQALDPFLQPLRLAAGFERRPPGAEQP